VENSTKGRIFIFRPGITPSGYEIVITDDTDVIGTIGPQGFLCWEREAGDTVISCLFNKNLQLPVSVKAGQNLYIRWEYNNLGSMHIMPDAKGVYCRKHCIAPTIIPIGW